MSYDTNIAALPIAIKRTIKNTIVLVFGIFLAFNVHARMITDHLQFDFAVPSQLNDSDILIATRISALSELAKNPETQSLRDVFARYLGEDSGDGVMTLASKVAFVINRTFHPDDIAAMRGDGGMRQLTTWQVSAHQPSTFTIGVPPYQKEVNGLRGAVNKSVGPFFWQYTFSGELYYTILLANEISAKSDYFLFMLQNNHDMTIKNDLQFFALLDIRDLNGDLDGGFTQVGNICKFARFAGDKTLVICYSLSILRDALWRKASAAKLRNSTQNAMQELAQRLRAR